MVFTTVQTTSFFEDADQMVTPHATVTQLLIKGIDIVHDLRDFDKDILNQVVRNLRRPPGGAAAFIFGAKLQKRLLAVSSPVKFYENIRKNLTASNMYLVLTMKTL